MRWTHKSQNKWHMEPTVSLLPRMCSTASAISFSPCLWPCHPCRASHCLQLLASSKTEAPSSQHQKHCVISLLVGGKKQLWLYYFTVHMKVLARFATQWQIPNQPDTSTVPFLFHSAVPCSSLDLPYRNILIIHFQSKHFRLSEIYFFQLKCSLLLCSFLIHSSIN